MPCRLPPSSERDVIFHARGLLGGDPDGLKLEDHEKLLGLEWPFDDLDFVWKTAGFCLVTYR